MIKDIHKYRLLNKLKSVYRFNTAEDRKESSAEHSWGCLALADYFLETYEFDVDKLRVFELLLYHDTVEIIAGDVDLLDEQGRIAKQEEEFAAVNVLRENLPQVQGDKLFAAFMEFEDCQTPEAQFAKAIDAFEAVIHEMDYKEDWKEWTRKVLEDKKGLYFERFPQLQQAFSESLDWLEQNGYFNQ